jgi:hypothetical protein
MKNTLFQVDLNLSTMELQKTEIFFRYREVPFHTGTWSLDPRNSKHFPRKTGFRYAQASFERGFNIVIVSE